MGDSEVGREISKAAVFCCVVFRITPAGSGQDAVTAVRRLRHRSGLAGLSFRLHEKT